MAADEPKAPPEATGSADAPAKPSPAAGGLAGAPPRPSLPAPPKTGAAKPVVKPEPWSSPLLDELQRRFPSATTDALVFRNQPSVTVAKEHLIAVSNFLKSEEGGALGCTRPGRAALRLAVFQRGLSQDFLALSGWRPRLAACACFRWFVSSSAIGGPHAKILLAGPLSRTFSGRISVFRLNCRSSERSGESRPSFPGLMLRRGGRVA